MADLFVSYSHEDSDWAGKVVCAFEAAGFSVDWDNRLSPGERYNRTIPSRIANAQQVVVLWSKSSSNSDWVCKEAEIASKLRTIAPLRLDDTVLPDAFMRFHTHSLSRGAEPASIDSFVEMVGAKARHDSPYARTVANDVRQAFHARRIGDFEGATDHLQWALRRFEVILDDPDGEEFRDADRYKVHTIRALEAMASRDYCGKLMRTLAGESLLPVIDAVLELRTDQLTARFPDGGCVLKRQYRRRKFIRTGVIIRPGDGVNDAALIEKLLSESDSRQGPLHVDCFLLIMGTSNKDRQADFSSLAAERQLHAKCLIWQPADGDKALESRLLEAAAKVCNKKGDA